MICRKVVNATMNNAINANVSEPLLLLLDLLAIKYNHLSMKEKGEELLKEKYVIF